MYSMRKCKLIRFSISAQAGSKLCSRLLLPIEARRLDRRLASISKLLLPARVDLIGVLLECEERALDFFMSLRILDDTVRQADVTIGARLPQLPRLLALAARCGALLGAILVPERTATSCQDNIRVAQVLEEGWQPQGVHAA